MIIRSKDKKQITNFNQLTDLSVAKTRFEQWEIIACYPYFADSDCGYSVLATYSTEEKAIKVLDMICDACRAIAFIDEKAVVFDMPSDEEVWV